MAMKPVKSYVLIQYIRASLSALIKEKEITAGYTAGCDLYITKPFKQDELISKISQLLDKSYKNKDKEKKIR